MNGYVYLYNFKGLKSYDDEIVNNLPKTDFYKALKTHFVELKENGSHKTIIREDYKIYFAWGILQSHIEIYYSGLQGVKELIILAKLHNWSLMITNKSRKLVNLEFIDKEGFETVEDFLEDKQS